MLLDAFEKKTGYTRFQLAFFALLMFGIINICTTYTRLSHAFDEAPHVGAGMEWWNKHQYTFEPKHPPLPRIMVSALLYMAGNQHVLENRKPMDSWYSEMWYEGSALLHADGIYTINLILARLGTLPFFVVSCFLVHRWSRNLYGEVPALMSMALYVTLPTLAGHAGMAATDMGHACMLTAGIMATIHWLKTPTFKSSLLLAVVAALMIDTKLSCLAHFPAAMGLIFFANYAAKYRWGKERQAFAIQDAHYDWLLMIWPVFFVVAGSFIFYSRETFMIGMNDLIAQNKGGHATWLFHALNNRGVWYYFPVVYFFKTPFAFLASNVLASVRILREIAFKQQNVERLFPILAAGGVFISSMPSNINVGIRHVLPIYPLLAVPAGYGLLWLWQQRRFSVKAAQAVFALLLSWQVFDYFAAFPDRISYFNAAGYAISDGNLERISPDSDVDWGQGFLQLADSIEEHKIRQLHTCFWLGGSIRNLPDTLGLNPMGCPNSPPKGWLAISRVEILLNPQKYAWLNEYKPVENVGRTLLLYYFP